MLGTCQICMNSFMNELILTTGYGRLREVTVTSFLKMTTCGLGLAWYAYCRSNWDHGILPALFPNAAMVETIVTGSMAAYLPLVRSYAGEVPIVSLAYASSEAFLGVNLRPTCAPEDIAYTLIPSFAYYEFLPVSQSQSQSSEEEEGEDEASQLVDLADVKLGQVYELVLTTAGKQFMNLRTSSLSRGKLRYQLVGFRTR